MKWLLIGAGVAAWTGLGLLLRGYAKAMGWFDPPRDPNRRAD